MADLTISVTESVTINGATRGSTNTKVIASIIDTLERVVTVPTSEVNLYSTHASIPGGSIFDKDLVKYVRITNTDATNFILLRISNDANDEFLYKLGLGESFILHNHSGSMNGTENAVASTGGLEKITDVTAQSDTASCQVEVFVASI
tara:strand:- start:1220 stop:1663 length:444 start_codon:yes stop_codon:yes gene_type:complete